jgi:DNA polymerase-1
MRAAWARACQTTAVLHGATFDLGVASAHLGLAPPLQIWDTMVGAFLLDPFARDLGLKTLTSRDTGERDELQEYIRQTYGVRGTKKWAEYIGIAHEKPRGRALAARYARADVQMTRELYRQQVGAIRGTRLEKALPREMAMPALLAQMTRDGMGIDRKGLTRASDRWVRETLALEQYLLHRLGADTGQAGKPRGTLNSSPELAAALREAGLLKAALPATDKGNVRTDRETLETHVGDPLWLAAWRARQQRRKVVTTFALPWLAMSEADGRVHAAWFSTRGSDAGGAWGARTGRLVSSPNLQNIPKAAASVPLPEDFPVKLGAPPALRQFIVPAPGHVLLRRDYSQQELRILAHFEGDALARAYQADPKLDMHTWTQEMIRQQTGLELGRDQVKTTAFSILYGAGVQMLSRRLKVEPEQARQIRNSYLAVLPGIRKVQDELSALEYSREPYWTWGDRPYHIETQTEQMPATEWGPEHEVTRSFAYKALNYLIQGSAADCTKQAMVSYEATRQYGRMVCCVHDEMWVEVPAAHAEREMWILMNAMESDAFRVPMLSDGMICRKTIAEAKR